MTADSIVSIVGGRNIGGEYFDATSGMMFADLDVAVAGQAAHETAENFDRYWNDQSAYPAQAIIGDVEPADLSGVSDESREYLSLLMQTNFANYLTDGQMPLVWARTMLISDHPSKVLKNSKNKIFWTSILPP